MTCRSASQSGSSTGTADVQGLQIIPDSPISACDPGPRHDAPAPRPSERAAAAGERGRPLTETVATGTSPALVSSRTAPAGRPSASAPTTQGSPPEQLGQLAPAKACFSPGCWELTGGLEPQPAVTRQERIVQGVLRSADLAAQVGASSSQCAPDGPSSARWTDRGNDRDRSLEGERPSLAPPIRGP
jgi:hypothetical protein